MHVCTSHALGPAILRALGINEKGVTSLRLELEADSLPIVHVERVVFSEESGELLRELEQYEVKPRDAWVSEPLADAATGESAVRPS